MKTKKNWSQPKISKVTLAKTLASSGSGADLGFASASTGGG